MAEKEVIVKKVKPYPIPAQFVKETHSFSGQIQKLVMHGFLVELGSVVVKVGDIYQVSFQFPVLGDSVTAPVKVIKTYDKYQAAPGDSKAMRLAEYHFLAPTENLKKSIKGFMKVIRQSGNDIV